MPTPKRTFMMVEYDYKLEANTTNTTNTTEKDDNIFSNTHPLENALLDIDTNLVDDLQQRIPNGDVPDGKLMPDVKFNTVNSRFVNMCFTESDSCKWVKSRIKLSFSGDRPKPAMERVTLALVQDYLQEINDSNPLVETMFVYPVFHSSVVQFDISPLDGPMNDEHIKNLESSFYNVFHAIVSELDGDTDISEGYFVYQYIRYLSDGKEGQKVSVNMKYYGKCRFCSKPELVAVVNDSIESNTKAFLRQLKKADNTTYFQNAEDIAFSVPQRPEDLPPIANDSIFDAEAPRASKTIPWLLYLGAFVAVLVLAIGVCVIVKDQKDLMKEDASTGDESSIFEERNHDPESDSDSNTNDDTKTNREEENESRSKESVNVVESGIVNADIEGKGSMGDKSVESKASVNSKGMHSDYEIYVF